VGGGAGAVQAAPHRAKGGTYAIQKERQFCVYKGAPGFRPGPLASAVQCASQVILDVLNCRLFDLEPQCKRRSRSTRPYTAALSAPAAALTAAAGKDPAAATHQHDEYAMLSLANAAYYSAVKLQSSAGGLLRTSTRLTLNQRTEPHVCMSIHPERKSCRHIRSWFECLLSKTLQLGQPEARRPESARGGAGAPGLRHDAVHQGKGEQQANFGISLPARSADALPAPLCRYFTQAIYRNRPITRPTLHLLLLRTSV